MTDATATPIVLLPGEGPSVASRGGGRMTFKATRSATGDRFGLFESLQPPHSAGPELHYHRQMVEMFRVLEGRLDIVAGARASRRAR